MVFQLEVRINFRSGHRLIEPYEGKCNNVHGEGYTAIVILEQQVVDETGMIIDFSTCKKIIKQWIDDNWDHAYIGNENDIVLKYLTDEGFRTFDMGDINPTAENMAYVLHNVIKKNLLLPVKKVGIVESFEDSIAWYEG